MFQRLLAPLQSGVFRDCSSQIACVAFYDMLPPSFADYGLVASHSRFTDLEAVSGNKIYGTIVRHPVQRLISIYRFWRSFRVEASVANGRGHLLNTKGKNFEEFIQTGSVLDNELVRHFADVPLNRACNEEDLEISQRNICKLAFILRSDYLDHDLRKLFTDLGAAGLYENYKCNVTDENHMENPQSFEAAEPVHLANLSEAGMQALHRLTMLDTRLYDMAQTLSEERRNKPADFDSVPIERAELQPGEVIVPSTSTKFLSMLASGWSHSPGEQIAWSVDPKATLKFRAVNNSSDKLAVQVRFNACMVTNRKHQVVDILCGDFRRTILFLQQNIDVLKEKIDRISADVICVSPRSAEIEIDLGTGFDQDYVHTIEFVIKGGAASPLELGHNTDDRRLGVCLEALEAA